MRKLSLIVAGLALVVSTLACGGGVGPSRSTRLDFKVGCGSGACRSVHVTNQYGNTETLDRVRSGNVRTLHVNLRDWEVYQVAAWADVSENATCEIVADGYTVSKAEGTYSASCTIHSNDIIDRMGF